MGDRNQQKSKERPLRIQLRRILELLTTKREMKSSDIALALGVAAPGISRPLRTLEHRDLITRHRTGNHVYVRITKEGRNHLKYHPIRTTFSDDLSYKNNIEVKECLKAKEFNYTPEERGENRLGAGGKEMANALEKINGNKGQPVKDERRSERTAITYEDTVGLWRALGLRNGITLSSDSKTLNVKRKDGSDRKLEFHGFVGVYRSTSKALEEIHRRRGLTNLYFCPAEVKVKHSRDPEGSAKLEFVKGQALWLDLDIERQPRGSPLPQNERNQRLTEVLQKMVDDGLVVNAIVDSGAGYHIYLLVQNYIRNRDRLTAVLKSLATRYGGDPRTAHPTAYLRVPNSRNIKVWDGKVGHGGRVVLDCKLFDLKTTERNCLVDVERALGLRWRDPWWEKQQRSSQPSQKANAPEMDAAKPTHPKPGLVLERLLKQIKSGYAGSVDHSAQDFGLMCNAIRLGYSKQEVIGFFLDPANGVCITTRKTGNRRDERYLERTFAAAYRKVSRDSTRPKPDGTALKEDHGSRLAQTQKAPVPDRDS